MTQTSVHQATQSYLLLCAQPDSPANLSVPYSHVHQAAFLLDKNDYFFIYFYLFIFFLLNRGPSHAKYTKMVTTEIQKNHVGTYK